VTRLRRGYGVARVAGSSTTLQRLAKRAACENEHGAGSGDERLGSVAGIEDGIEESARAREPDETPPEVADGSRKDEAKGRK